MRRYLVVKTSSLGDILQSLYVADYLKRRDPGCIVDWVVKKEYVEFMKTTLLIDNHLEDLKYDVLFDLQGNIKSALITLLSKAKVKVGFGFKSVSEWPNLLVTSKKFNVDSSLNMRLQYLQLVQKFFNDKEPFEFREICFKINKDDENYVRKIETLFKGKFKCFICPFSRWPNKMLREELLVKFLKLIGKQYDAVFLFTWGNESEREAVKRLTEQFPTNSLNLGRASLPLLQNIMRKMNRIIGVDSALLHLAGLISTPAFGIFGPTKASIFEPLVVHKSIQGRCPHGVSFIKKCPFLKRCKERSCMNFSLEELYTACFKAY